MATPGAPEPAAEGGPSSRVDLRPGEIPGPPPGAVVPEPGPPVPGHTLEVLYSQAELTDGTQISGTLTCSTCTGPVVVHIEDADETPPQPLTRKSFDILGPYTMQVPPGKRAVVIVVDDTNGDGMPTPGEAMGIWTGGLLDTSRPGQNVDLEVGVMPEEPPIIFDGNPPAAKE